MLKQFRCSQPVVQSTARHLDWAVRLWWASLPALGSICSSGKQGQKPVNTRTPGEVSARCRLESPYSCSSLSEVQPFLEVLGQSGVAVCCHRCCPTLVCGGCPSGHTGVVRSESPIQVTSVTPLCDNVMSECHDVNVAWNSQVSGHKVGQKKSQVKQKNKDVRLENSSFIVLNEKISITAYCVSGEGLWFSVRVTEGILSVAWDLSYCFFLVRTSITYCEDFCLSLATWGN